MTEKMPGKCATRTLRVDALKAYVNKAHDTARNNLTFGQSGTRVHLRTAPDFPFSNAHYVPFRMGTGREAGRC